MRIHWVPVFAFFFLLTVLSIGRADEASSVLVFADGSTVDVASATLVRGTVIVETLDGRKEVYDPRDIDLEGSGLVRPTPSSETSTPAKAAASRRLVLPEEGKEATGIVISDQDVGHIRPTATEEPETEEEGDDTGAEEATPLRVEGVTQRPTDGGVNVTGTVFNDGVVDLENTTITAVALDADEKVLGQGSVGIPQKLTQGGSRSFSLNIPVIGEVASVRVSARATAPAKNKPKADDSETAPREKNSQSQGEEAGTSSPADEG